MSTDLFRKKMEEKKWKETQEEAARRLLENMKVDEEEENKQQQKKRITSQLPSLRCINVLQPHVIVEVANIATLGKTKIKNV